MVARGNGATRVGALTLLSPAVLFKNALGFTVAVGTLPATTTYTWISYLVVVAGALALSIWVFLFAQGVETWEATAAQRWILTVGLVAVALFPVLFADRNYEVPAPPVTNAPPIRALFARGNGSFALASPGGSLPRRCCDTILNRDTTPLGTDMSTGKDLFILLPVDVSHQITDLRIQVVGDNGLQVDADSNALANAGAHLERRQYQLNLGPPAADGHRITTGWVARVPVTFTPTHPWDIGGVRYPLDVEATYHVVGDDRPQVLNGRAAVEAEVSSAVLEMAGASAILPFCCFVAAFVRWRRTR